MFRQQTRIYSAIAIVLLTTALTGLFGQNAAGDSPGLDCDFSGTNGVNFRFVCDHDTATSGIGPYFKDIKARTSGGTTYYYLKYLNFPFFYYGSDTCPLYSWQPEGDDATVSPSPYDTSITVTYTYIGQSCNSGTIVTVTITLVFWQASRDVVITVRSTSATSATRSHFVYQDWALSDSSNPPNPDTNQIRVFAGGNTPAAGHLEENWPVQSHEDFIRNGYPLFSSDVKFIVMNENYGPVFPEPLPYIAGIEQGSASDDQVWVTRCQACTPTGSSQYTNGPWDYANNEYIYGVDIHVAARHVRATSSTDWTSTVTLKLQSVVN